MSIFSRGSEDQTRTGSKPAQSQESGRAGIKAELKAAKAEANQPKQQTQQYQKRLDQADIEKAYTKAGENANLPAATVEKYTQINDKRVSQGKTVDQAGSWKLAGSKDEIKAAAAYATKKELVTGLDERAAALKAGDQVGREAAEAKIGTALTNLDSLRTRAEIKIDQNAARNHTAISNDRVAEARGHVAEWKPSDVKASTRDRYAVLNDRMERQGKGPEDIAGTRQSFYTYRAAKIHSAKESLKNALSDRDRAMRPEKAERRQASGYKMSRGGRFVANHSGVAKAQEWNAKIDARAEQKAALKIDAEKRIEAAMKVLEKYPPTAGDLAANSDRESAYKGARFSENSNGKREALDGRDPEWRDKVFAQVEARDKNAVAALALTGARPAELSKGIKVERTQEGATFTVQGAKFGANRGTESRTVSISNSELEKSSEGLHIQQKFAPGKTGTIKADGTAVSARLGAAGERADIGGEKAVSGYDYRHAFSARNKQNTELTAEARAEAMGHRSIESQGAYGRAAQNGGAGNIS